MVGKEYSWAFRALRDALRNEILEDLAKDADCVSPLEDAVIEERMDTAMAVAKCPSKATGVQQRAGASAGRTRGRSIEHTPLGDPCSHVVALGPHKGTICGHPAAKHITPRARKARRAYHAKHHAKRRALLAEELRLRVSTVGMRI